MKHHLLLAVPTLVLTAAGCSTQETTTASSPPSLVGRWRSVAFEGADQPPFVENTEFEFGADGTFTNRLNFQGAKQSREVAGSYAILEDTTAEAQPTGALLKVTRADGRESPPVKFWFDGEELIIADPNLDSRIRLRRVHQP